MGMRVRNSHMSTIQGQICPDPCLIGLTHLPNIHLNRLVSTIQHYVPHYALWRQTLVRMLNILEFLIWILIFPKKMVILKYHIPFFKTSMHVSHDSSIEAQCTLVKVAFSRKGL